MSAAIARVGAFTSVGTSAAQTFTSVRAGIARLRATSMRESALESVVLGWVPDSHVPPLAPRLATQNTLSERQQRMLRLAHGAWENVSKGIPYANTIPLYLGVPETLPNQPSAVHPNFLADLAVQCPNVFAPAQSKLFADGRASVFLALQRALADLRAGTIDSAWIGGVDTYLDPGVIAALDRDGRLKTLERTDGFHPGEGAAFVLLTQSTHPEALCDLPAVGVGLERGHLGSHEPLLGDGLADAVREALASAKQVKMVLSGLNGEYLGSKEWGVAARRSHQRFAQDVSVIHPAEFHGDPGAACGAILLALGAFGLARGTFTGEVLAWSASDGPARGAALLRERVRKATR